jgi:cytochrome c oxidase cbb3-type subunit 3
MIRDTAVWACVLAATVAACRAQPESLAAAAAPALARTAPDPAALQIADTPIGPLPGEPEDAVVEATNPFRGGDVALAEGRRLFVFFNCAGCHGDHGGGGMGPSLRDRHWLYGGSDAKIANSIAEGRAHGMPAWGTKITSGEVWKLTAYITSLRTPREPQAPTGNVPR